MTDTKHASFNSESGFRHLTGMRVKELAAGHAMMDIPVCQSRAGCIITELFPRSAGTGTGRVRIIFRDFPHADST